MHNCKPALLATNFDGATLETCHHAPSKRGCPAADTPWQALNAGGLRPSGFLSLWICVLMLFTTVQQCWLVLPLVVMLCYRLSFNFQSATVGHIGSCQGTLLMYFQIVVGVAPTGQTVWSRTGCFAVFTVAAIPWTSIVCCAALLHTACNRTP
jgi:hypothetical protein